MENSYVPFNDLIAQNPDDSGTQGSIPQTKKIENSISIGVNAFCANTWCAQLRGSMKTQISP